MTSSEKRGGNFSLDAQLADTQRRIGRLVDALAGGPEDLPSVRNALAALEHERERLEGELAAARATEKATPSGDLAALIDPLLEALHSFQEVLEAGEPEERKAVIRAFLEGITIEKTKRQAILRWYRLPRVGESVKLVELRGLEPLTPRLPALCSPN